jgi:hypothetical protein
MTTLYSVLNLPNALFRDVELSGDLGQRPAVFSKLKDTARFAWRQLGVVVTRSYAATPFSVSVASIVEMGTDPKVSRIDTKRYVAPMEDAQPIGDASTKQHPRDAMSAAKLTMKVKGAVAITKTPSSSRASTFWCDGPFPRTVL